MRPADHTEEPGRESLDNARPGPTETAPQYLEGSPMSQTAPPTRPRQGFIRRAKKVIRSGIKGYAYGAGGVLGSYSAYRLVEWFVSIH